MMIMFFHTCSRSWKAFTKPILCGGARYQVLQQGRKKCRDACPALSSPAAGQGSLLHHWLLDHVSSAAITRKGFSQAALSGHHNRGSSPSCLVHFWPFFCEPSVTSKPISRFFLWVYHLRAFSIFVSSNKNVKWHYAWSWGFCPPFKVSVLLLLPDTLQRDNTCLQVFCGHSERGLCDLLLDFTEQAFCCRSF